jgi:hypothetical protein
MVVIIGMKCDGKGCGGESLLLIHDPMVCVNHSEILEWGEVPTPSAITINELVAAAAASHYTFIAQFK